MLKLYNYISSTKTLGPYNRFAIWTQGCDFGCKNCMTKDSWDKDGGYDIQEDDLAKLIKNTANIEGVTITGGEPILQAKSLNILLDKLDNKFGLIVYTGFTKNELDQKNDKEINQLLSRIDILIDGQYQNDKNDGQSLVGSSNQKIHQLSNRYNDVFDKYYGHKKREVEIHMQENDMMIVGIPTQNILLKVIKCKTN